MRKLTFHSGPGHFDGKCVRFAARDGDRAVSCGVTVYALKHHCAHLPTEGLLPAEAFLDAYKTAVAEIHHVAARKYLDGSFEPDSDVDIMVHDHDFH